MKQLWPISIAFLILINSCGTSPQESNEQPETPALFSYEIIAIDKTADGCAEACATVKINYLDFNEGLEAHNTLNEILLETIKMEMNNYQMEEVSLDSSLSFFADRFLAGHKQFKDQFPESNTPWKLQLDMIVSHTQQSFASFSLSTSSYTGGAHANSELTYFNLSLEGEKLDLQDFVTDQEKLKSLAEEKFRSRHQLAPDDDLAEAGFIFSSDQFELTDNFGFTRNGMVFYYNSYEIAPYSEGPTVLFIPFEELTGILD